MTVVSVILGPEFFIVIIEILIVMIVVGVMSVVRVMMGSAVFISMATLLNTEKYTILVFRGLTVLRLL